MKAQTGMSYKTSDPSTNSDFPIRIRKVEQSMYSYSEFWSACRVPFRKGSSLRQKVYNQFRRSNKLLLSKCILRSSVRCRRLDVHPFRQQAAKRRRFILAETNLEAKFVWTKCSFHGRKCLRIKWTFKIFEIL